MIRERLRSWLGIDKTDKKVEELVKEVSLVRENLEAQITELKQLIKQLSDSKAEREIVKELSFRIDELEREIRALEKFSLPQMEISTVSREEQLKAKILTILSAREQLTISELQSLSGSGWKKLYKALRELEKEKKVKITPQGKRKMISLTTTQKDPGRKQHKV